MLVFSPFDCFLGPSSCKDYFLEKVLCTQVLYEVPEESQFLDSVWWLYKPVMKKGEVSRGIFFERIKSALKRK